MNIRRWIYLLHRWLGIAMCLFMAMWFFSGIVMMYVGFPTLTPQERLSGLPELRQSDVNITPQQLLQSMPSDLRIADFKLTSVMGRPAYMVETQNKQYWTMFADTGELVTSISPQIALSSAKNFARQQSINPENIRFHQQISMDQWTVSGSLHSHRPLYKIDVNDAKKTQLYISSKTGQVVRDTSAHERVWNWLGANLHWIYPLQLRRHPDVWHWVIVGISLLGLTSILTGAYAGFQRLKLKKRYRGKDVSPYRGQMKLHHILGLLFLIPLTTYLFSGLMSMNPWQLFTDATSFTEQQQNYTQTPLIPELLTDTKVAENLTILTIPKGTREITWYWVKGKIYSYAIDSKLTKKPFMTTNDPSNIASIKSSVDAIMAPYSSVDSKILTAYDSYYYSHHERSKPLPVLRLTFNDPEETWFHIDMTTGQLLGRLTANARRERWLYNGLHSLDFHFLISHRPLWDIVVISLCLLGLTFSTSSLIIGWRRLRFKRDQKRRKAKIAKHAVL